MNELDYVIIYDIDWLRKMNSFIMIENEEKNKMKEEKWKY